VGDRHLKFHETRDNLLQAATTRRQAVTAEDVNAVRTMAAPPSRCL
jgi:hypothetical protein